jgi:hypothetical protein
LPRREIDFCIRKSIGGQVAKPSDGKPIKIPVLGSVIQSYTEMESREGDDDDIRSDGGIEQI